MTCWCPAWTWLIASTLLLGNHEPCLAEHRVFFVLNTSSLVQVLKYDLLVGSDGAGSCVRQALAEVLPPGFCRIRKADNAYAMTPLPAAEPGTKTYSQFYMHAFKVRWGTALDELCDCQPALMRKVAALLQHALCRCCAAVKCTGDILPTC